jgi:S-adenosylmethionine/arginine decarboxylase-like enzyme
LDLVFIDLYECDHGTLLDADKIREAMLKAAGIMGAEIVGDSFHTFSLGSQRYCYNCGIPNGTSYLAGV